MGLYAGVHVRVAFLTEDGEIKTSRKFMLTKDSLDKVEIDKVSCPYKIAQISLAQIIVEVRKICCCLFRLTAVRNNKAN